MPFCQIRTQQPAVFSFEWIQIVTNHCHVITIFYAYCFSFKLKVLLVNVCNLCEYMYVLHQVDRRDVNGFLRKQGDLDTWTV